MAVIMAFCNVKGGSGKTTLSMNVAGSLKGKVLLVDADPQQSALQWADSAPDEQPLPFGVLAYSGKQIHRELIRLTDQYDYIVVDTPPSGLAVSTVIRSCLLVADLAVVPVAPSPLDIKQTLTIGHLIVEISDIRGDDDPLYAKLVINRLKIGTTFGREIRDALEDIGIPVCGAVIHEREAHKHAALDGVTVHQISTRGGRAATTDIEVLASELTRIL